MKGELIRVEIYKAESGEGVIFDFHRHIKHPLTGEPELHRRLLKLEGLSVFDAVNNGFDDAWQAGKESMEEDDCEDEGLPRIEEEEEPNVLE